MATRLIKASGTAVLVGTIDGKEVAVTVSEAIEVIDMWFMTASSETPIPTRVRDLIRDYLETAQREVQAESF